MTTPTTNERISKRIHAGTTTIIGLQSSKAALPQLQQRGQWLYAVNQGVPMPESLAELGRKKRHALTRALTALVGSPFDGLDYLWLSEWPGVGMKHRVLVVQMPLPEALSRQVLSAERLGLVSPEAVRSGWHFVLVVNADDNLTLYSMTVKNEEQDAYDSARSPRVRLEGVRWSAQEVATLATWWSGS